MPLSKLPVFLVHPHIRGAYSQARYPCHRQGGSSPHTWGILHDIGPSTQARRFIPTYVGHTQKFQTPRCVVSGSSPHTWGIQSPNKDHHDLCRFIPTSVGHTHEWKTVFVAVCGSSPPTWGIPSPCTRTSDHSRFIPTYVGHTPLRTVRENFITVHPHIRGAYIGRPAKIYVKNGSSPHTWGIQHLLR